MKKTEAEENERLLVRRIKDGTVIDHIQGGEALNVVKILGITGHNSGDPLDRNQCPEQEYEVQGYRQTYQP